LLDGHHHAPAPVSGGLLDMDAPYSGVGANNAAHSDFLGMTAPAAGGYPSQGGQPYVQPYGQQQQQQQQNNPAQNAFSNNNNQQGPFGGLQWS